MFRPKTANFREYLFTKEYMYGKMLSKMSKNKINLQNHVIKIAEIYRVFHDFRT
jgi:hypothetical protein